VMAYAQLSEWRYKRNMQKLDKEEHNS